MSCSRSTPRPARSRVHYHFASFLGPESQRAANAAGCAADADRFPAASTRCSTPTSLRSAPAATPSTSCVAFGEKAGIDSATFDQCVRDSTYSEWVKAAQLDFDSRGLRGTPTVMIDGTVVTPAQYDAATFKGLLDAAVS